MRRNRCSSHSSLLTPHQVGRERYLGLRHRWHGPSSCSAAPGRTDLPLEDWPRRPPNGATRASIFAAGAITSRCNGASARTTTAPQKLALFNRLELAVPVVSAHRVSQAVCDVIDGRHRPLLPDYVWGDGDAEGRPRTRCARDAGHGPCRPEARRLRAQRLHRLADLVYVSATLLPMPQSSRTPCAISLTSGTRSWTCARSAASGTP